MCMTFVFILGWNGSVRKFHDVCWNLGLQVLLFQDLMAENIFVVRGSNHVFFVVAAPFDIPGGFFVI